MTDLINTLAANPESTALGAKIVMGVLTAVIFGGLVYTVKKGI